MPVTHWKCDCGAWIPVGFSMHKHTAAREPTLEEIKYARWSGKDESALDAMTVDTWTCYRTKEHPTQ